MAINEIETTTTTDLAKAINAAMQGKDGFTPIPEGADITSPEFMAGQEAAAKQLQETLIAFNDDHPETDGANNAHGWRQLVNVNISPGFLSYGNQEGEGFIVRDPISEERTPVEATGQMSAEWLDIYKATLKVHTDNAAGKISDDDLIKANRNPYYKTDKHSKRFLKASYQQSKIHTSKTLEELENISPLLAAMVTHEETINPPQAPITGIPKEEKPDSATAQPDALTPMAYAEFLNEAMKGHNGYKEFHRNEYDETSFLDRKPGEETFDKGHQTAIELVQKDILHYLKNEHKFDEVFDRNNGTSQLRFGGKNEDLYEGPNVLQFDKSPNPENNFFALKIGELTPAWRDAFQIIVNIHEKTQPNKDGLLKLDLGSDYLTRKISQTALLAKNILSYEATQNPETDIHAIKRNLRDLGLNQVNKDSRIAAKIILDDRYEATPAINKIHGDAVGYSVMNWTSLLQATLNTPEARAKTNMPFLPVNGQENPQMHEAMRRLEEEFGSDLGDFLASQANENPHLGVVLGNKTTAEIQEIIKAIPKTYGLLYQNGQLNDALKAPVNNHIKLAAANTNKYNMPSIKHTQNMLSNPANDGKALNNLLAELEDRGVYSKGGKFSASLMDDAVIDALRKLPNAAGYDKEKAQALIAKLPKAGQKLIATITTPNTSIQAIEDQDKLSKIAEILGVDADNTQQIASALTKVVLPLQKQIITLSSHKGDHFTAEESFHVNGKLDDRTMSAVVYIATDASQHPSDYASISKDLDAQEAVTLSTLLDSLSSTQKDAINKIANNQMEQQATPHLKEVAFFINRFRESEINPKTPNHKISADITLPPSDINLETEADLLQGMRSFNIYIAKQLGVTNTNGTWTQELREKLAHHNKTENSHHGPKTGLDVTSHTLQTCTTRDNIIEKVTAIKQANSGTNEFLVYAQWLQAGLGPAQDSINARILATTIGGADYNKQLTDAHSAVKALPILEVMAAAKAAGPKQLALLKGQTFDVTKDGINTIGVNTHKQINENRNLYGKWVQSEIGRDGNILEALKNASTATPDSISDEQIRAVTTLIQAQGILNIDDLNILCKAIDPNKGFLVNINGKNTINVENIDLRKIDTTTVNLFLDKKSETPEYMAIIKQAKQNTEAIIGAPPESDTFFQHTKKNTTDIINATRQNAPTPTDPAEIATMLNNITAASDLTFNAPAGTSKDEFFKDVKALANAINDQDQAFLKYSINPAQLDLKTEFTAANQTTGNAPGAAKQDPAAPNTAENNPSANPSSPKKPVPLYTLEPSAEQKELLSRAGITGEDAKNIMELIKSGADFSEVYAKFKVPVRNALSETNDNSKQENNTQSGRLLIDLYKAEMELKNSLSNAFNAEGPGTGPANKPETIHAPAAKTHLHALPAANV